MWRKRSVSPSPTSDLRPQDVYRRLTGSQCSLVSLSWRDSGQPTAGENKMAEVCLLVQSPLQLLKVAARGNLDEFVKVFTADPKRLNVQDSRGQRPLHVAATKGHSNIVEFIVQQNGGLDHVDEKGDTALHAAVRHNHPDVITLLLQSGADHSILNEEQMAPLHLACDLGHLECVKALLEDTAVDRDIRGELGMRPLHYCCHKDQHECARLLLECGARPCQKCDVGFFPLHVAAKCAAANTLEILIQYGMKRGYDRATLLTFKDKENNMPLHAAVNGGNIKAVEVCLRAGAPVDTQQDDQSTPVHFAAAQGNLDMIRMMYEMQKDNFLSALHMTDAMGMTPLHRAALFNHRAVVALCLDQGADINSKDSTDCTPLLLAASKGCWETVQELVMRGADIRVRDQNNRNFLHLAIRFGGKLQQFFAEHAAAVEVVQEMVPDNQRLRTPSQVTLEETAADGTVSVKKSPTASLTKVALDIRALLDERDDFGCTPLHYASREGHLLALEDLIKYGATPSLKNNDKQSPFHFATRYGRYNTCRRLLELAQGPNIINETDAEGLTGLHIAAQNGHTKIISLLLHKGAVVQRDNDDNTPLHHAAAQGWTQSMRTLMAIHSNLLDQKNFRGETALHLAAQQGRTSAVSLLLTMGAAVERDNADKSFFDYVIEMKQSEVALAIVKHDRWEEVLLSYSSQYGCPFLGLIEHMPSIAEAVLDRCQVESEHEKKSPDYFIEYNYRFLGCPFKCIEEAKRNGNFQPMMTLNAMVRHGRVNCLSHPVCISFLKLKWNTYGLWFYMLVLLLYVLFLASLTLFVVLHDSLQHHDPQDLDNRTLAMLHGNSPRDNMSALARCAVWIVAIFSVLSMIKEVFQMATQRLRYFRDGQNAFEWALYVSSLLFAAPFLLAFTFHWQWEAGALAVFFAWFNLLVILQRFDFFGIYVVMFLEILRTLLQALCVFSVLIVAFGLSFYMLMKQEASRAHSSVGLSLLRTAMMMLETDYMASFNEPFTDGDDSTLHFGGLSLFMVAIFVLLMPILLMNLLIGLAVGDIESVQKDARLKRLAGQVELHTDMERKMPLFLLARFDQPCYKYFPNKCKNRMANLWSQMTAERDEGSGPGGHHMEMGRMMVMEEMMKQKHKLKEMNAVLEKNNQLLKLVVQKMEIHTEDDAWDEGLRTGGDRLGGPGGGPGGPGGSGGLGENGGGDLPSRTITKNSFRRRMMQKSAIVSYIKKGAVSRNSKV